MYGNYTPSSLVLELSAIQRSEIDCPASELKSTVKRCKDMLDSIPETLTLSAGLVLSDFYEHMKAAAAANAERIRAFVSWAEKTLAARAVLRPKAHAYTVTDLDTGNISEIPLSEKPIIDHWVVTCYDGRFKAATRNEAENMMLNAMTKLTVYRSINQIGKQIGYEVYACDAAGHNFPMSGLLQGPMLYPSENEPEGEV